MGKNIEILQNIKLADYSTIKVGGHAEYFCITNSRAELLQAIEWARLKDIPLTIIGWGSNTLISDNGIQGLVIVNKFSNEITISGELQRFTLKEAKAIESRLDQLDTTEYYQFADLDYDESHLPITEVKMEAGVPWTMAVNSTIAKGLTGLQYFSGIPGTVGGAVYNNMHGGTHFVSEFIKEVEVITISGEIKIIKASELEFDYDFSRFHNQPDIILAVNFNLHYGDKERALKTSMEWARRKKQQPARSLGCTWKNICEELKEKLGFDSTSMGYIVDKKLNLKGAKIGKAKISDFHAAFIETKDGATANDVYELIKLVRKTAEDKYQFSPELEIVLKGNFI